MNLFPRILNTTSPVFERFQFYLLLLFVAPSIYVFEMVVVFPQMVVLINAGPVKQFIHMCLGLLCFINVCGNMIMCVTTELNKPSAENSTYCDRCNVMWSSNSWHCKKCNICVLRRDHHCSYLARCIGLFNKRYYLLFLAHVTVSMLYAAYYNYHWIDSKFDDDYLMIVAVARLLNPLLRFLITEPLGERDMYLVYLGVNLAFAVWAGSLFHYHINQTLMGVTHYESRHFPEMRNSAKWKENLIEVFGVKWYWAIVWPFCSSPLPSCIKTE
ncbi:uncharacterized protein LOC142972727 [Anticarsia gemmatalis]|uniref:uncharacterized protein LOC142972727 n=1 Tax=Anticarsia gemmatalis TaxID=129554 RepID=UPI003F7747FB